MTTTTQPSTFDRLSFTAMVFAAWGLMGVALDARMVGLSLIALAFIAAALAIWARTAKTVA